MADTDDKYDLLSTMDIVKSVDANEFLIRGKSEVMRILSALADARIAVSVSLGGMENPETSRLLEADEASNTLLLECPPTWQTCIGASDKPGVMLVCQHDNSKIQFPGLGPVLGERDGTATVRIDAPPFLWRFRRRRHERHEIPNGPPLKIMLNLGFSESEAEIADISLSGVGAIHCDPDMNLDQNELLRDCVISLPGVGRITANLTVRHVSPVALPDKGAGSLRVGCEFAGMSDEARNMISAYLSSLD
ncbi:MAG: flagellar regulator YcgR PilZN domain-containing protein [Burkholderiales bacterium]